MVRGSIAGSGKQRWVCYEGRGPNRIYCHQTTNPNTPARKQSGKPIEPEPKLEFKQKHEKQTVVLTWAQNATPIHKGFVLGSLQAFLKARNAQLIVQPGRYKNPTSYWLASQENEQWWAPELVPYLCNQRLRLNKNLESLADIPVQSASPNPLGGLEALSHSESSIVGHPRLELKVIPTPHQRLPKILTTTGAVTVANYTETPTGAKGEFHHVLGAVVAEIVDSKNFHLRHINARRDGAFCDLDKAYYPDGRILPSGPYKACIFGDTHVRFTDPLVTKATFGRGGLVERLNPKLLVFHDLCDGYAVNPHHEKRPYIAFAKFQAGYCSIEDEIREVSAWMIQHVGRREARIVASNHNDFLMRWMNSYKLGADPINALFHAETHWWMLKNTRMTEYGASVPDPFVYWMDKLLADYPNIQCLGRHDPLMVGGVLLSLHGDEGANGARGSLAGFANLGVKTVTGHAHVEGIKRGAVQVATSTRTRAEYTGPISSWTQTHCSLDPFDKRHLHRLIDGRFWAEDSKRLKRVG